MTSTLLRSGIPAESGYTRGFAFWPHPVVAIVAAVFIPTATSAAGDADHEAQLQNAELAISAGPRRTRPRPERHRTAAPDRPSNDARLRPPAGTRPGTGSKILAAARAVFDEEGVDVGVEVIAQRAGVGVGTLYRRFPTKELLIEAVVDELLERC